MKIELSPEELVCLLFWYRIFEDRVKVSPCDTELFERLRESFYADKGHPLDEYCTGTPRYQPGDKPLVVGPGDSGEGE